MYSAAGRHAKPAANRTWFAGSHSLRSGSAFCTFVTVSPACRKASVVAFAAWASLPNDAHRRAAAFASFALRAVIRSPPTSPSPPDF